MDGERGEGYSFVLLLKRIWFPQVAAPQASPRSLSVGSPLSSLGGRLFGGSPASPRPPRLGERRPDGSASVATRSSGESVLCPWMENVLRRKKNQCHKCFLPWSTRKRGWAERCKTRASKAAYFNKLINIFEWLPLCAPRPPSVAQPSCAAEIFTHRQAHRLSGAEALGTGGLAGRGRPGGPAPTVPAQDLRVHRYALSADGGQRRITGGVMSEVAESSSDPRYGPQLSPQLRRPRGSEGLSCFTTCSLAFLQRVSMELMFLTAQVSRAFHWRWAGIRAWAAQVLHPGDF